jgi:uncharacterized protein
VILVDANLLLYTYHLRPISMTGARLARIRARQSRAGTLRMAHFVGLPADRENPRAFELPLTVSKAQAAITSWLAQPSAGILEPGERHWDILSDVLRTGQTSGPLVMDAVLAAIAIEHGATICTTDRDFARFPAVRWTNPLAV